YRRSVIEPGAPIPAPVPPLVLERRPQPAGVRAPGCGSLRLMTGIGQRCETHDGRVEKPAQPDALAATICADAIHPVVPVAGADQRQAVTADGEASVEAAGAMLEQRSAMVGYGRLEEALMLAFLQFPPFQEKHRLLENCRISGDGDIVSDGVAQPNPIVGVQGSYARAGMRQ